MIKDIQEVTFDDLVNESAVRIHSALLEGGGREMKSALHQCMAKALEWKQSSEYSSGSDAKVFLVWLSIGGREGRTLVDVCSSGESAGSAITEHKLKIPEDTISRNTLSWSVEEKTIRK